MALHMIILTNTDIIIPLHHNSIYSISHSVLCCHCHFVCLHRLWISWSLVRDTTPCGLKLEKNGKFVLRKRVRSFVVVFLFSFDCMRCGIVVPRIFLNFNIELSVTRSISSRWTRTRESLCICSICQNAVHRPTIVVHGDRCTFLDQ